MAGISKNRSYKPHESYSPHHSQQPAADDSSSSNDDPIVRTALCVEARGGVIHVFMPPLERIEQYLELVSAIEVTAEELSTPVRIEGYPPPYDYRIDHFKVTPDPGVIEVNLQPARTWKELVRNTTTLYEEAHLSRLSTEKFMLDGRHSGAGGGNHIVMGGPSPAQSPFLRRPDSAAQPVVVLEQSSVACRIYSRACLLVTPPARRHESTKLRLLRKPVWNWKIACKQIRDNGTLPAMAGGSRLPSSA